jgi:hypothetical protein
MLLAAPLALIDPDGFYNALAKPSLVALWLSQLVVFAVYPRVAARHGQRVWPACLLALVAGGLAVYGLWTSLHTVAS